MDFWKNYNENLFNLTRELLNYNQKNTFNYVESDHYNHIRDLVALSLTTFNKNKKVEVLDFGSNTSTWSNLNNKISTQNLDVTIYDPFSTDDYSKKFNFGFDVKVINQLELIKKKEFNFTIFGSSSQYISNFLDDIIKSDYVLGEKVLFTHTPLSKGEPFITQQSNSFSGQQIIRSYHNLVDTMDKKKYSEIFKSTLPPTATESVKSKQSSLIIYANILFIKQSE